MATFNKSLCLLLVIFKITGSLASYYISEGKSVWSNVSKQCRSSTPEIVSCSDKRDKCSLEIDNDIDMPASDESIWIGYYKTEMAFEYIGCVAENKIPESQKCSTDGIDKDPRRCYPECIGSTFIGLSKDKKCYCFDNLPHTWNSNDLLSSSCYAVCKRPVNVACGGEQGENTYISLYKINPKVIGEIFSESTEEGNNANCLKLSEERPEWEKCEKKHGTLCGNGTFNLSDKPDKSRNWFDAAKQCFKTGKYPISYSTASSPETFEDNSVWTGVFKMNIIYKQLQETSSGYMNSDIKYGYLSSDLKLRFTGENNTKRVLCEKEPVDTTTSSKKKDTKTTQPPPDTKPVDTTTSSKKKDTKTTQPPPDTNTGVAVIVSTTVVLVIILVVVTVVLVYRRYISSQRFDKMQEASETVVESEYNYPEFHYNRHEGENESAGVEYNYPIFSVQEASNNLHSAGTAENSPPETGIEVETFEQAKHVYNQSENEGAYNVIGRRQKVVPGKAYDQAAPFQKSGTSASDDITYDASMSSGVKLKISHEGPTDNVYNTKIEIYNRLGDETEKHGGKTDNLYGTKQMEKHKYILKPVSVQNDQTYNSTSENCEECGVTDNPYSKLDTQ